MEITNQNSEEKRGLFGGRKVYISTVTVSTNRALGRKFKTYVDTEKLGGVVLAEHSSQGDRGATIRVLLSWVTKDISKGKNFSWTLIGSTPSERDNLFLEFVGNLEPIVEASGVYENGTNGGFPDDLQTEPADDTALEVTENTNLEQMRDKQISIQGEDLYAVQEAIAIFVLVALKVERASGRDFNLPTAVEFMSRAGVFSGLSEQDVDELVGGSISVLEKDDPELVDEICTKLIYHDFQHTALAIVLDVMLLDGILSDEETIYARGLAQSLRISDAEMMGMAAFAQALHKKWSAS